MVNCWLGPLVDEALAFVSLKAQLLWRKEPQRLFFFWKALLAVGASNFVPSLMSRRVTPLWYPRPTSR